jgi:molybdate transport repressor ModE-like protein
MTARIFLRLEFAKPAVFGKPVSIGCHLCSFLEAIAEFGSASTAGRAAHLGPQETWSSIRFLNSRFKEIIDCKRGWRGGATLTPHGVKLVERFRKIEQGIQEAFAADRLYLERLIDEDSNRPPFVPAYDAWRMQRRQMPETSGRAGKLRHKTRAAAGGSSTYIYLALSCKGFWFGAQHSALLQAIMKFGSLAAAAESVGKTYYQARREVRLLNKRFPGAVVTARGRSGGAYVTPKAQKFVARFCKIERDAHQIFADDLRQIERLVGVAPDARMIIPRDAQLREPTRAKPRRPINVHA